ncbi:Broad-complex core protein isoform 6 [Dufourea novaeangliae]|uniref:Broad-complex core protein isoform 6 n=1 Tax=Dufourea novaeangliae TaxID=178035 RepID=A0A154P3F4_DUFNO|nr:Broad-complex core protein isoform 6 [Dufourea novaeangliae]
MGSSQQFSLRWNNYLKHITCAFDTLRTEEDLVDVNFRDLFKENPCQHPVIIFRNVKFDDLAALVDFMYQGEVNVVQEQLASFLTTAELLAVQGLTDGSGKDNDSLVEDDMDIPNEPEIQLQNTSSKTTDNKRMKSPLSPMPYHAVDLQPDAPPSKRRKCRENANANAEKAASNAVSAKDSESKTSESQTTTGSDPVEIIPLMPNLKLEMPEYLVQDGSSCSYEDQSLGDGSLNKIGIEDTSSNTPDHDQKPDISQTFYSSSQSTSDTLDLKHQSADVGHLLSKPSTSGERLTQEAVQERAGDTAGGGGGGSGGVSATAGHVSDDDEYGGRSEDAELLFRCRICLKGFKHPMSLTLHKDLHTGQTRCPICQRIFSRSYDMKSHLLRIHKCTLSVDAKLSFASDDRSLRAESEHDTTTTANTSIGIHRSMEQQQEQRLEQLTTTRRGDHRQQNEYTRRGRSKTLHDVTGRWVCDVCGRVYNLIRRNKFIESHARTPAWSLHSPGSFCDKCGITFTTQHALLRHVTSKHEEPRTSTAYCNICKRFFKTKWSLATHTSKYHRN